MEAQEEQEEGNVTPVLGGNFTLLI